MPLGKAEVVRSGKDVAILALGTLGERFVRSATILAIRVASGLAWSVT
jgi:transketolase C-terminal domain/subunit